MAQTQARPHDDAGSGSDESTETPTPATAGPKILGPAAVLEAASRVTVDRLNQIDRLAAEMYQWSYENQKRKKLVSLEWLLNSTTGDQLAAPEFGISEMQMEQAVSTGMEVPSPLVYDDGSTISLSGSNEMALSTPPSSYVGSSVAVGDLGVPEELLLGSGSQTPPSMPDEEEIPAVPISGGFNILRNPMVSVPSPNQPSTPSSVIEMNLMYQSWVADPLDMTPNMYSIGDVIKAGLETLSGGQYTFNYNQALSAGSRLRFSNDSEVDSGSGPVSEQEWQVDPIEAATRSYLRELLTSPPSPLKTFIGLREVALLKACMTNAEMIGLWNPLPQDFKDPYKSPFVQSYYTYHQDLQAVKQKYNHIAKDLQPVEIQCKSPHRSYIDVFPFPTLRSNLIRASAGDEDYKGFNELEFCLDLSKEALVIWGSGHGVHGGEPWNPRSWEAKPWFLNKWAMVLDEELIESSRWWRRLREEDVEELD